MDRPVSGSIWGRPPPRADHGGPVGAGSVRQRGDTLAAHRPLLLVSHALILITTIHWTNCSLPNGSQLTSTTRRSINRKYTVSINREKQDVYFCPDTWFSFPRSPHVNISQAPSPSVKKRKVSLIFDHMEPDEMAEHLSYLEFKNFCNISVSSVNNLLASCCSLPNSASWHAQISNRKLCFRYCRISL